jgi:hypothetical protein
MEVNRRLAGLPHPFSHPLLYLQQLPRCPQMQRRQKPPEGALRRQLRHLQNPGKHRVVRHKAQVIQAGKAHIQGQHHPQQELVDRHDSRDASDGQGFFYQLLKSQFLQHRGHWEQAAIGS